MIEASDSRVGAFGRARTALFALTLGAALFLAAGRARAAADPPPLLPIQGFLADAAGSAIDGAHGLRFSLYPSETSTTALFVETDAGVAVSAGSFVVYLGEKEPLSLSLFRDSAQLWLEVVVDGTEVIRPRVRIATAPYAGSAQYCSDAATLGGSAPGAFALAAHTHAFASLTGVPPGLADGDDDRLASLACADGQVPKSTGGAWGCANDVDTDTDTDTLARMDCRDGQVVARSRSSWACSTLAPIATSGSFADLGGVPSGLVTSPGGIIELGDSAGAGTAPAIDFHFGVAGSQDYNARIINAADGQLDIVTDTLRVRGTTSPAPNVVMGQSGNSITAGVRGATISGGGGTSPDETGANRVTDNFGTVSGGVNNQAGDAKSDARSASGATVAGGYLNVASGPYSTVGGGRGNLADSFDTVAGGDQNQAGGFESAIGGGALNTAGGWFATVPGGAFNAAAGDYSFAAGRRAKANQPGCFAWGDSQDFDFLCTVANSWAARATGGVYFITGINGAGSPTAGVSVAPGAGTWSTLSDRNAKRDIQPVDPQAVLAALERVPVATWRYKAEVSGARHMGPMAQDFQAAFGLGDSDKQITTVDADGVALAAVAGLHAMSKQHAAQLAQLARENAELRARLQRLESSLGPLSVGEGSSGGFGLGLGFGAGGIGLAGIGAIVTRRRRGEAA